MAKIISVVRTLRNHWKKSVFGCLVIAYGIRYAKEKHECNVLMAEYCRQALMYGNVPSTEESKIRNIVVFLNPAANKRKAKKDFDKYCAPLLYLTGNYVTVVQTKSQGEARLLAEQLNERVDAVVVAGGDGTLCETITGLLRRETGTDPIPKRIPVGILPLGQTNTVAKSLFGETDSDRVKMMAEATMAVIRETRRAVDIIRIEQLEKEREDQRPVYSAGGFKWGAVHDVYAKRENYWYWGALRTYMAYVFMGLKDGRSVTWNCSANLCYSLPCSGCSQCYEDQEPVKRKMRTRWWQSFVPKQPSTLSAESKALQTNYSQIKNDECSKLHEVKLESVDVTLKTSMEEESHMQTGVPHIEVKIGPASLSYWDFVARGWQYTKGNNIDSVETLQVKDLKLQPNTSTATQDTQHWFYIDNDDYEVKPIYIKLLSKRLLMFCLHQFAESI